MCNAREKGVCGIKAEEKPRGATDKSSAAEGGFTASGAHLSELHKACKRDC